jgi:hypothetical protein
MPLIVFDSFTQVREFAADRKRQNYGAFDDAMNVPPGTIVSEKLDGIYARADRDGLWTKDGRPITGQQHLNRRLRGHFRRRPESVLEGELTRGEPFEKTLSDYRSDKKLRLNVFPGQKDKPLPVFGIRHVAGTRVANRAEADRHYQKQVSKGKEGQILQLPSGERIKRKVREDDDYVVESIRQGKRRMIADVRKGETRAKVVVPAETQIGSKVTVESDGRTTAGKLRAPRVKAIRDYE